MKGKMSRNIVIPILIICVLLSGCTSGTSQNPGKGTLQLTSSPSGAEIYIDNQYRGSTPSTIASVEPGNHTLEFRYSGYNSWSAGITVSSCTSQFYASMSPVSSLASPSSQPTNQIPIEIFTPSPAQTKVTIQAGRDPMIIGDSNLFSGTGAGTSSVLLTLYGPGYYSNGVRLAEPKTNSAGSWSYTWNPGTSIQSGSYTLIVSDAKKITSDRVSFSAIGGGEVTISANSYSASRGDSIAFSGRCTSGAPNVLLVLYGPDRFSSGVELGPLSVMADKTWNFRYTLDSTMPKGIYTMNVYDLPKTTSGSMQFTVGFV